MLTCEALVAQRGGFQLGPLDAVAPSGSVIAVVGPNASGKTTLLETIARITPHDAGRVLIDEVALETLPAHTCASRVVFLPQHPMRHCALSAGAVVHLGRMRQASDDGRVKHACALMDLEPLLGRSLATLSAGQAHRVHIARVLAQCDPHGVLVLDEPAAALDPDWAGRLWAALRSHARGGGTVIVSVHDVAVAAARADQAWLLDAGRLVAAGSAGQTLTPASLEAVFGVRYEHASRRDGSSWLIPGADVD